MGHARALVSAGSEEEQLDFYRQILEDGLSVRDVESTVKAKPDPQTKEINTKKEKLTEHEFDFKNHLADKISSKVDIKKTSGGSGKIVINFSSESDLNRIIELLNN